MIFEIQWFYWGTHICGKKTPVHVLGVPVISVLESNNIKEISVGFSTQAITHHPLFPESAKCHRQRRKMWVRGFLPSAGYMGLWYVCSSFHSSVPGLKEEGANLPPVQGGLLEHHQGGLCRIFWSEDIFSDSSTLFFLGWCSRPLPASQRSGLLHRLSGEQTCCISIAVDF